MIRHFNYDIAIKMHHAVASSLVNDLGTRNRRENQAILQPTQICAKISKWPRLALTGLGRAIRQT